MQQTSIKVSQRARYDVWLLGQDMSAEMTDFVHAVYQRRFGGTSYWNGNEYQDIQQTDQATQAHSLLYCAYDYQGHPLATVRAICKYSRQPLPTENDFSLDFVALSVQKGFTPKHVYEIGRLAKDGQAMQKAGIDRLGAVGVVEDLIGHVIRATEYDRHNVWVASIDQMVLMLLRSRGYGFEAVGPTVDYLGSPTTPVMLPVYEWQAAQPAQQQSQASPDQTERSEMM